MAHSMRCLGKYNGVLGRCVRASACTSNRGSAVYTKGPAPAGSNPNAAPSRANAGADVHHTPSPKRTFTRHHTGAAHDDRDADPGTGPEAEGH